MSIDSKCISKSCRGKSYNNINFNECFKLSLMGKSFQYSKRREKRASAKILENKKLVVSEIQDKVKSSESVIIFSYQGLTVSELSDLRIKLREANGEVKVYKNTLVRRALGELKIDIDQYDVVHNPNDAKEVVNMVKQALEKRDTQLFEKNQSI